MSTAKNDITGDSIATKSSSDAYRDGWERIFGKKKEEVTTPERKKRGKLPPSRTKRLP